MTFLDLTSTQTMIPQILSDSGRGVWGSLRKQRETRCDESSHSVLHARFSNTNTNTAVLIPIQIPRDPQHLLPGSTTTLPSQVLYSVTLIFISFSCSLSYNLYEKWNNVDRVYLPLSKMKNIIIRNTSDRNARFSSWRRVFVEHLNLLVIRYARCNRLYCSGLRWNMTWWLAFSLRVRPVGSWSRCCWLFMFCYIPQPSRIAVAFKKER